MCVCVCSRILYHDYLYHSKSNYAKLCYVIQAIYYIPVIYNVLHVLLSYKYRYTYVEHRNSRKLTSEEAATQQPRLSPACVLKGLDLHNGQGQGLGFRAVFINLRVRQKLS